MIQLIKTTVLGGIVFLVPIVIFIAIIGKAISMVSQFARPLAQIIPTESVSGFAVVNLITIIFIILICFVAGLAAKTVSARRFVGSLETNVLSNFPAYDFLKSKITTMVPADEAETLKPVLARFDDTWQIAFEVERVKEGMVTLFVPGAPDPWSGTVCYMTEDRIKALDANMLTTLNSLKGLGKGTVEKLQPYF